MRLRDRAFAILRNEGGGLEGVEDSRDEAFIHTIVQGVIRWRLFLDFAASKISERKLDQIDPLALEILRVGLYQVWFMDVPDHAAVSETVDLAEHRHPKAKGFVNAVLRKATRTTKEAMGPDGDDVASIAIRNAHPDWLVQRWVRRYGKARTEAIARANQELSRADALVNTTKIETDELIARLRARDIAVSPSVFIEGMIRLGGSSREVVQEVDEGLIHLMDEGSAAVARLGSACGSLVLDLAAAPGGKSIAMNLGGSRVIANDVSRSRLLPLLNRWRVMFGTEPSVVVGDASTPPFRGQFDVVLLDSPCSASGIIRRHPEIRHRLSESQIRSHARRQARLLEGAMTIDTRYWIYSTCSLEPEENDDVVMAALRKRDDVVLGDLSTIAPAPLIPWIERGILRLTPDSGADGFTAFLLERAE